MSTKVVNKKTDESNYIHIDETVNMAELVTTYPELAEVLTYDYGLHCVNCMISEYDTLGEGAAIHGIEGEDLKDMIKHIEQIINKEIEED